MLGKLAWVRISEKSETRDPAEFAADILRYAFFRLGNLADAEDVVARVLADAVRSPRGWTLAENPRLYLIGMARRRVADLLRKRHRSRQPISLDDPTFVPPATDGDIAASQRRIFVASVLRRLEDDEREVLALKYLSDLSSEEIAAVLGRTTAAVNSLLQRARKAFADHAGDAELE